MEKEELREMLANTPTPILANFGYGLVNYFNCKGEFEDEIRHRFDPEEVNIILQILEESLKTKKHPKPTAEATLNELSSDLEKLYGSVTDEILEKHLRFYKGISVMENLINGVINDREQASEDADV